MKTTLLILNLASLALLSGCGNKETDIHAIPRETQAYESAPVQTMNAAELIAHIQSLADAMTLATQSEQFVEMHHLEIALTKALVALEPQAPSNLKPAIETLKIIAVKIHGVGHDQNKSMAATLNTTLQERVAQLKRGLE